MYIVTIAARISNSVLPSEALKRQRRALVTGADAQRQADFLLGASMAFTASPSEAPGARLNDTVATGNWPRWLIDSGVGRSDNSAIADSGTCLPLLEGMRKSFSASGELCAAGSTSSTTRYWLDWVKIVETSRCP